MLTYSVHVKELLNNCVSCGHLGESHHWFRLTFVSLFLFHCFCHPDIHHTPHQCWNCNMWQAHCLWICKNCYPHSQPNQSAWKASSCSSVLDSTSASVNLMPVVALMKAIHNCQLCDLSPSEFVLLAEREFSLPHPCLSPSSTQFFLTRCFLYRCLKHSMMPK